MPAKKKVEAPAVEEEKKTVKKAAKKAVKEAAPEKAAEAVEEKAVKKAPAKKATAKKAAEEKAEKKPAEKKAPAKKAAAKKTTEEKAEKKAPAKKAAAKKPAAKKASKKAEPEVAKKSVKDYEDVINWKKGEAHGMDWLYIEINAGDLLTEVEAGVDNLATACQAILNCMLEGDHYIVEPAEENKVSETLTVRYYCDNLSEDRRKYFEI